MWYCYTDYNIVTASVSMQHLVSSASVSRPSFISPYDSPSAHHCHRRHPSFNLLFSSGLHCVCLSVRLSSCLLLCILCSACVANKLHQTHTGMDTLRVLIHHTSSDIVLQFRPSVCLIHTYRHYGKTVKDIVDILPPSSSSTISSFSSELNATTKF